MITGLFILFKNIFHSFIEIVNRIIQWDVLFPYSECILQMVGILFLSPQSPVFLWHWPQGTILLGSPRGSLSAPVVHLLSWKLHMPFILLQSCQLLSDPEFSLPSNMFAEHTPNICLFFFFLFTNRKYACRPLFVFRYWLKISMEDIKN